MLDLADSAAQEGYRTFRTAHDRDAAHVVADLASTTHGLSADEAERRLRQHGPNSIPTGTRRHPVLRFLAHFNNALIYFLLAGAAAAAALGHLIDTGVILAVVLVNAVVGFLQEGKAEDALAALRRNAPELRHLVAKAMTLKYAPQLRFVLDETFDRMDDTRRLFADERVRRDLDAPDDGTDDD